MNSRKLARRCVSQSLLGLGVLSFLTASVPSLLMAGTPQEITFPPVNDRLTADSPFALSATSSSGLPVTYSITSPAGVATVSGNLVTLSGTAGAVTIKASQAGNASVDPAADVHRSFVVGATAQRFVKLAKSSCSYHSAGIRADGTLWTWGSNWFGQLGIASSFVEPVPVKVGAATTWTAVACGNSHTVALRNNGTLWTWGDNTYGQLGSGSTTSRTTPTQVGSVTTWSAIACGSSHTVALRSDGTLWAWGANDSGQLGDGSTTQRNAPVQIGTNTTWSAVASGLSHTLALRSNGTLWGWGNNSAGQVGKGVVVGAPIAQPTPVQIGTATNWTSVACGGYHSLGVRGDGTLWTWGNNGAGQIGDGAAGPATYRDTPLKIGVATTWASVAGGTTFSIASRTDGTLWGWGQLGGLVNITGSAADYAPSQIGSFSDWTTIGGGDLHAGALRGDGILYSWGDNSYGQQGTGVNLTTQPTPAPVGSSNGWSSLAVGDGHVAVLGSDGTLWTWGTNSSGELGNGTTTGRISVEKVGNATWRSVVTGDSHTAGIRNDGTLWTWGDNVSSQVGDGTAINRATPVQIADGSLWNVVACGRQHTAAIRSDGTLWAWGENSGRQLGDGTTTNRPSPVQIGTATTWRSVSCGASHTAALRSDGTLWAWGANSSGQIGDGTTTSRGSPVQIGNDTNWSRVVCGADYTLGIRSDGTLWAWGENGSRQLGDATTTDRLSPVQTGNGSSWTFVACGKNSQVMAVSANGTLWTWGASSNPSQIGTATNWAAAGCDASRFVALRSDGTLWAWGSYSARPLNHEPNGPQLVWPARVAQTLTFPALPSLSQGHSVVLVATASSGLPVTYTVAGPATLTGDVLTPIGAGPVTVAAYENGNSGWFYAPSLSQTVNVPALTSQQSWRQTHFGTTVNTGNAADSADYDQDGLPNLVEFAFGLNPTTGSSGSSQLPQPVHNPATETFTYTFSEPGGVNGSGVIYSASASQSLQSGSWFNVPDTGSGTTHVFTVPTTGNARMFIQLHVTTP